MKETCKNCSHCKLSYKGGVCEIKQKKVKLQGSCEDFNSKK